MHPVKKITDIKSLLDDIEQGRYVTIRCEHEYEKCNFFLGKIMSVSEDSIEFISLGADGKWNSEIDTIAISDITMITFDDYYAKMFFKYVEQVNV